MFNFDGSGRPGARARERAPGPGPEAFATRSCLYWTPRRQTAGRVAVAVEEPLEIRVDGAPRAVLMRTPGHELELAAGFCLTEGIVDCRDDLWTVEFCGEDGTRNAVDVVTARPPSPPLAAAGVEGPGDPERDPKPRASRGVTGHRMLEEVGRLLEPLAGAGPGFDARRVAALHRGMEALRELFHLTRGSHAAALVRADGEVLAVREDVGRHNALDKAIGHALLRDTDLGDSLALVSGRISFEIVQKAVRAGIPLVATASTATSLAVTLAEAFRCTLVGGLRDADLLVYTHPSRFRDERAAVPSG